MSAKIGLPCVLLSTLLVVYAACGQEPTTNYAAPEMAPTPERTTPSEPEAVNVEPPGQLSSWIAYTRPECCGPVGGNGPIGYEVYARTGPATPVWGGKLSDIMTTGWQVQGGGRSLFFNAEDTAAWTGDLNLTHQYFHAKSGSIIPQGVGIESGPTVDNPQQHLAAILILPVTVRSFNQTMVGASIGRECYLKGTAHSCGCKWRVGMDVGGRWGACTVNFAEIRHLTDTVYGPFGAIHTDVEVPITSCCTFIGGLRFECDWLHNEVLRNLNSSDFGSVGYLINLGVGF